jgi:hypothetical protein
VGAALLLGLVIVETRVKAPVLDVHLFLNGTFLRASVLLWSIVAFFYGSLFLIPFFFENVRGQSPLTAGEILIGQGVASAIGIALGGELYNKLGPRTLVTAGAVALAVSMIGFTRLTVGTTGLSLQGWLVLRGLGLGLTTTPLQNLALSRVRRRDLARASSLVNVSRQVFGAAGLATLVAYATQRAVAHGDALQAALRSAGPKSGTACPQASSGAIIACVRQHAIVMGLNDTFFLALIACCGAVLLAFFVGTDPTLVALKAMEGHQMARAFPHLSREQLLDAHGQVRTHTVPAGSIIIRQGDAPDFFYIVNSGEVRVTRQTEDGEATELATLGPGQYFGEIGLLANVPRTATVTAVHDTELLAMDAPAFANLIERSELTGEALRQVMWQRLSVMP